MAELEKLLSSRAGRRAGSQDCAMVVEGKRVVRVRLFLDKGEDFLFI